MKYAFPNGRGGKIYIDLNSRNDNKFTMTISDNGIGFPTDLDLRNTDSLGLQLVATLVDQLEGTMELDKSDGTQFKIEFYKEKERS